MIGNVAWLCIAAALSAMLASAASIYLMLRTGLANWIVDVPNSRSMHIQPVPRIGGICLIAASVLTISYLVFGDLKLVLFATVLIALVSLCDDIWTLAAGVRLCTHTLCAIIVVLAYPPAQLWMLPIVALCIVWMTNLFNFMDGLDGLSGGMAAVGFGAYAVAAFLADGVDLAIVSSIVTGASVGFLLFNFPPARVFMGDGGAIPLGFLAGVLGYIGWIGGQWPWWFGPFVFSPFIVDASTTLMRRLMTGERIWRAHRMHYYQRLAQSAIGQFGTLLSWYVVIAAVSVCALLTKNLPSDFVLIVFAMWIAIYAGLMFWIDSNCPQQVPDKSG